MQLHASSPATAEGCVQMTASGPSGLVWRRSLPPGPCCLACHSGLSAAAFVCAILPPLVGMFMRGSTTEPRVAEIESALWIALATLGAASTGGATAMVVIYGVAVAVAWMSGSERLTAEVAGFALLGLVFSLSLQVRGGSWLHAHDAAILADRLWHLPGSCCVGVMAVLAAGDRSQRRSSLRR